MFQKLLLIGALLATIGSAAIADETAAPAATTQVKSSKSTAKRHSNKKVSKQGRKARSNARRPKAQTVAVSDGGMQ